MLQIKQGNFLASQPNNSRKHHQHSLSVDLNRKSSDLITNSKPNQNFNPGIKPFHMNSQSMQFQLSQNMLGATNTNKFNISSSRKYKNIWT
jgi:hypothetical protein